MAAHTGAYTTSGRYQILLHKKNNKQAYTLLKPTEIGRGIPLPPVPNDQINIEQKIARI